MSGGLPQPAVAHQRAPEHIISLRRAILAVKNTSLPTDSNQSRNTAKETAITSGYGENKAQVHLLKK